MEKIGPFIYSFGDLKKRITRFHSKPYYHSEIDSLKAQVASKMSSIIDTFINYIKGFMFSKYNYIQMLDEEDARKNEFNTRCTDFKGVFTQYLADYTTYTIDLEDVDVSLPVIRGRLMALNHNDQFIWTLMADMDSHFKDVHGDVLV